MFLASLETIAGPQKRVIDQLSEFAGHFTRNAVSKWPGEVAPATQCVMQECEGEAILRCLGCGHPVCLAHIHVSHRADGVCDHCVRDLLESRPQAASRTGRTPGPAEIRASLRRLRLPRAATWVEIQRAHRRLAAEHHPDRAKTPAQRLKMEQKAAQINAAFATLRLVYEKDAA